MDRESQSAGSAGEENGSGRGAGRSVVSEANPSTRDRRVTAVTVTVLRALLEVARARPRGSNGPLEGAAVVLTLPGRPHRLRFWRT